MNITIIDAFTDRPFKGNPAAVCLLDSEIPEERMQRIANEMNLSETAFLLRREAGYSLRWFTPQTEVDLCGHATLASAHYLWEEAGVEDAELTFVTRSGLLTATRESDWIRLDFPSESARECEPPADLIAGLGTDYVYIGRNRMDYLVEVADEDAVLALRPNMNVWSKVPSRGVIVTSKSVRPGIDFVSRCFFPAVGVDEDPVTGSAHCCLGPYWSSKLQKRGLAAMQLSSREGYLKVTVRDDRVLLMGQAVTTLRGRLV
ncbi:MAG: PhzF family phenazine biosynthesis protein [Cohnella sp.]|nr:PhzF family phenazine biosynthesis protein [Cohnella sp.]